MVKKECRICYDEDNINNLIAPCNCKGTIKYIHKNCLKSCIINEHRMRCSICKKKYKIKNANILNYIFKYSYYIQQYLTYFYYLIISYLFGIVMIGYILNLCIEIRTTILSNEIICSKYVKLVEKKNLYYFEYNLNYLKCVQFKNYISNFFKIYTINTLYFFSGLIIICMLDKFVICIYNKYSHKILNYIINILL